MPPLRERRHDEAHADEDGDDAEDDFDCAFHGSSFGGCARGRSGTVQLSGTIAPLGRWISPTYTRKFAKCFDIEITRRTSIVEFLNHRFALFEKGLLFSTSWAVNVRTCPAANSESRSETERSASVTSATR